MDTSPAIGKPLDSLNFFIIGNGQDIVETVGTADITAGNAAPHIRTENGNIIKLYQQAAITAPTGGATVDAESRTAINSIRTMLQTAGLIAT